MAEESRSKTKKYKGAITMSRILLSKKTKPAKMENVHVTTIIYKGKEIITPFKKVHPISEERAIVEQNSRFGVIELTENGYNLIIPTIYDAMTYKGLIYCGI